MRDGRNVDACVLDERSCKLVYVILSMIEIVVFDCEDQAGSSAWS